MSDITPGLAMSAYFLGRRIAGQRKRKKLLAYLCNGVRVPPFPVEWDKNVNPYVAIGERYDGLCFYAKDSETPVNNNGKFNFTWLGRKWILVDGAWEEETNYVYPMSVLWSNYDVYYNEDAGGGLYIAASEPVPIYE